VSASRWIRGCIEHGRRPSASVAWLAAVALLAPLARVGSSAGPEEGSCSRRRTAGDSRPARVVTPPMVRDVVLGPAGVLHGRLVFDRGPHGGQLPCGWPVALICRNRIVAQTTTDAEGTFFFQNLPGGLYQIAVHGPGGPSWGCYRVWTRAAAPPRALSTANVAVTGAVVRGQSPFPITTFPRAATIAAIAAGAIAVPAIYHNTKMEPHIPASP